MSALISVINDFFCWFGSVLSNPGGFLNSCMNFLITSMAVFFPSTPASVKMSNLLSSVSAVNPLAAWFIHQVFLIVSPLLAVYSLIVIWKLLPFT